MLIDAHQHFWRIGRNDHTWPTPDLSEIYRDFLPADLRRAAEGTGLIGSVLVQSQPSDLDTDGLLDLAEVEPLIKAVVGWVDLASPSAPARIEALAHRSKLRGLRPMLQALPEDDWIATAPLDPAIQAMVANGLTLDALVFTRHLPFLDVLARRWPDLQIVIDHGAKPPIAASSPEAFDAWRDALVRIAERPNLCCKLSGLLTEARADQDPADLAPYVGHLVEAFGFGRLMWGSDWPVVNLAGSFHSWLQTTEQLLGPMRPEDLRHLFVETATRFYRLTTAIR